MNNLNVSTINPKYVIIGDSYLTGITSDGNFTNYGQYFANYMKLESDQYIILASDGSGFTTTLRPTFLSVLQNSTIENKESITDIIVCGGYNDSNNLNEIEPAISSFITYVNNTYLNAQVHIGMTDWYTDMNASVYLTSVIERYQTCAKYGAMYLNNIHYAMHNYSYFISDKLHPNELGQKSIAIALTQCVKTGSCNVISPYELPIRMTNGNSNVVIQGGGNYKCSIDNGISRFELTDMSSFAFNSPININGALNSPVSLGKFSPTWFKGSLVDKCYKNITVGALLTNNTWVQLDVVATIQNGYFIIDTFNFTDTGFLPIINVKAVLIPPFDITTRTFSC